MKVNDHGLPWRWWLVRFLLFSNSLMLLLFDCWFLAFRWWVGLNTDMCILLKRCSKHNQNWIFVQQAAGSDHQRRCIITTTEVRIGRSRPVKIFVSYVHYRPSAALLSSGAHAFNLITESWVLTRWRKEGSQDTTRLAKWEVLKMTTIKYNRQHDSRAGNPEIFNASHQSSNG